MFGSRKNQNSLTPPPNSKQPDSVEVLRVWASPGSPQQVSLRPTWQDPGAWGLMLVDIARHAANAYENEGHNREETLARIRALFDAEWASPTDPAEEVKS